MKHLLFIACMASGLALAPRVLPAQYQPRKPKVVRELVSVTWNVHEGKLHWDIAEGYQDSDGEFIAERMLPQPEIDPEAATMRIGDEVRRIDAREAASLERFLANLAEYAILSSKWWEAGEGEPLKKPGAIAQRF